MDRRQYQDSFDSTPINSYAGDSAYQGLNEKFKFLNKFIIQKHDKNKHEDYGPMAQLKSNLYILKYYIFFLLLIIIILLHFFYVFIRRVPSQDAPFLYTPSHLSEVKICKSIISTNRSGIFIFK